MYLKKGKKGKKKLYEKVVVATFNMTEIWHDQYMNLWAGKILGYDYNEDEMSDLIGAMYELHPILRGCDNIRYRVGSRRVEMLKKVEVLKKAEVETLKKVILN